MHYIIGKFHGVTRKRMESIYDKYLELCKTASSDRIAFKSFRSVHACTYMVETVGAKTGSKIYPLLDTESKNYLSRFATSDNVGKPNVYNYPTGQHSPTTLRYVKLLQDMRNADLDLKGDIVEIGGGYGGQCKIIYDYCTPKSYTIVDLPEVLQLQKRFLSNFGIEPILVTEPPKGSYDLLISNYAYTEFPEEIRKIYKNIIKKSKSGFIVCNLIDKTTALIELNKIDPIILPEEPQTGGEKQENFIYIWK
jgi:hypothetical protein